MGVAIVGLRGRGGDHISGFLGDERTVLLYLVDADEKVGRDRCEQMAKKQGGVRAQVRHRHARGLRRRGRRRGQLRVSSNHWHALCGVWAMQAEASTVYLEKPICHNVHEGRALVAAAVKYGLMCQVGTQCRSESRRPSNAVKFIHEGGIGEVKFARGLCYRRRKSIGPLGKYEVPKTVNYDICERPGHPMAPTHATQVPLRLALAADYGNGDLGNQGPHQTDIARWRSGHRIPQPRRDSPTAAGLGYDGTQGPDNFVDAGDTGNTEVSSTITVTSASSSKPRLVGRRLGR